MNTIASTTTTPIIATFTKWNDAWAIRTNRQITKQDRIIEMREVMGGRQEPQEVCYVEVTTKSGATKTVEVLEYQKSFGDSHIYAIR